MLVWDTWVRRIIRCLTIPYPFCYNHYEGRLLDNFFSGYLDTGHCNSLKWTIFPVLLAPGFSGVNRGWAPPWASSRTTMILSRWTHGYPSGNGWKIPPMASTRVDTGKLTESWGKKNPWIFQHFHYIWFPEGKLVLYVSNPHSVRHLFLASQPIHQSIDEGSVCLGHRWVSAWLAAPAFQHGETWSGDT